MIKIHVMHNGYVRVSPSLPYGGEHCSILKASGVFLPARKRIWLPVSAYLIEHPKGLILVDTGWNREMSPEGIFDKKAQIQSLGSWLLYKVNQGKIEKGAAVHEQLELMGIKPSDLDYVLCTHLDCDHVNGLSQVKEAKTILVSRDEMACAQKHGSVRYQSRWWKDVPLTLFDWTGKEGPFHHSYDLFGDGSVQLIHIPGHSDGQFAVKITNEEGKYVLLFADGGYGTKSWKEMILPGISYDKEAQKKSLEWIRKQSLDPNCIESLGNHDPQIIPHTIEL